MQISGIRSLIILIRTVQLAHITCAMWGICIWVYMCMKEIVLYWNNSSNLHCLCAALRSSLLCMINIGAHKPRWLPSPLCQALYISCTLVLPFLFFNQVLCTWIVCRLAITIISWSLPLTKPRDIRRSNRVYPIKHTYNFISWWRHQIEIFSALMAICAGNSPVPG